MRLPQIARQVRIELEFMVSMSSADELMYKTRKELVLIWDFNKTCTWTLPKIDFLIETVDFCHRFCFVNKITEPTRVTDRTKSLLDVILVSHAERYITSGNLQLGLSDHDLVFVVRKNKLPRPKPRFIEYHSMKNFDNSEFLTELRNVPWGTAYWFPDVDDIWGHWSALSTNPPRQHGKF